jgi:hypothetical protein
VAHVIELLEDDGVTWTDVMEFVAAFAFYDKGDKATDKLEVYFKRELLAETATPVYDREIRWTPDGASTPRFGGRIDQPLKDYPYIAVVAYSYGTEFLDKYVNEVFRNTTPEAAVEYVITNYTDLTYVAPTTSSGLTIGVDGPVVFKDKRISEFLKTIVGDILGWRFRTDPQKNAYLEPSGVESSGVTLTVGTDIYEKPVWEENSYWVVNRVIIEGDTALFNQPDTFTATASQTVFDLTYEPIGNVLVTDNGALQNPIITGATTGSYTLDRRAKTVTFSSGRTAGHTINISYERAVPIRVTSTRGSGRKQRKFKVKGVTAFSEARKLAKEYLDVHALPTKRAPLPVIGFKNNVRSGVSVRVVDATDSVNEELVVDEVQFAYPQNTSIISVGSKDVKLFDWFAEAQERVRQLEEKDGESEILSLYDVVHEDLNIELAVTQDNFARELNAGWIWGTSQWGNAKWGKRGEGGTFSNFNTTAGAYDLEDVWNLLLSSLYDDVNDSALLLQFNASKCAGYWALDGNANDSHGSNNGTPTSMAYATGRTGQAGNFNGSSSQITLPNSSTIITNNSNWTIEASFKADGAGSGRRIVNFATTAGSTAVHIRQETDGIYVGYRNGGGSLLAQQVSASFVAGTWYHVVVTYDGTNFRAYVNGGSPTVWASTFSGFGTGPAYIGSFAGGQYFDGLIEDVAAYSGHTLKAGAVALRYNNNLGNTYANLGSFGVYDGWDVSAFTQSEGRLVVETDFPSGDGQLLVLYQFTDFENHYELDLDATSGSVTLSKIVGGTRTQLSTTAHTFSEAETFTVKYINGVHQVRNSDTRFIKETDTSITAAGSVVLGSKDTNASRVRRCDVWSKA